MKAIVDEMMVKRDVFDPTPFAVFLRDDLTRMGIIAACCCDHSLARVLSAVKDAVDPGSDDVPSILRCVEAALSELSINTTDIRSSDIEDVRAAFHQWAEQEDGHRRASYLL